MPAAADFPELPPAAFARQDEDDDAVFYGPARLVTHIDDDAIAALSEFYRIALPPGGVLLDLMSSWISHLPADVSYGEVIGHGMNAEELTANPRLDRWFVQDLNRDRVLPLASASVDAAMICVSIQYLTAPAVVLGQVARVLRPDAPLVISFSNRCFATKAVAVWLALGHHDHARLVDLYLRRAGFRSVEARELRDGRASDPLTVVVGRT